MGCVQQFGGQVVERNRFGIRVAQQRLRVARRGHLEGVDDDLMQGAVQRNFTHGGGRCVALRAACNLQGLSVGIDITAAKRKRLLGAHAPKQQVRKQRCGGRGIGQDADELLLQQFARLDDRRLHRRPFVVLYCQRHAPRQGGHVDMTGLVAQPIVWIARVGHRIRRCLGHHHRRRRIDPVEQFNHPHGQQCQQKCAPQNDGSVARVLRLPGFARRKSGLYHPHRGPSRRLTGFHAGLALGRVAQQRFKRRQLIAQGSKFVETGGKLLQRTAVARSLLPQAGDGVPRGVDLVLRVGQGSALVGLRDLPAALALVGNLPLELSQAVPDGAGARVHRQVLGRVGAIQLA